jgi:hypothetical protein
MDAALKVQTQIRHNAEEVSSTLSQLSAWEREAAKKDAALRQRALERTARSAAQLSTSSPGTYHNTVTCYMTMSRLRTHRHFQRPDSAIRAIAV